METVPSRNSECTFCSVWVYNVLFQLLVKKRNNTSIQKLVLKCFPFVMSTCGSMFLYRVSFSKIEDTESKFWTCSFFLLPCCDNVAIVAGWEITSRILRIQLYTQLTNCGYARQKISCKKFKRIFRISQLRSAIGYNWLVWFYTPEINKSRPVAKNPLLSGGSFCQLVSF